MKIRLAKRKDYNVIVDKLQNFEKIDYLTDKHVERDIRYRNCYVLEDRGKIVAIGSIVYDNEFKMYYIKRLMVLDSNSRGKGYGKYIMKYLSNIKPIVATTPFKDNYVMRSLIESIGFEYKYTFLENYQLFVKGQ